MTDTHARNGMDCAAFSRKLRVFCQTLETVQKEHRLPPVQNVLLQGGCLTVPLTHDEGGLGFGNHPATAAETLAMLRAIGRLSLSYGRILEGHINVVRLVELFGTPAQRTQFAARVREGKLAGIWVTDGQLPVTLHPDGTLTGTKGFASAVQAVDIALITARTEDDQEVMLLIPVTDKSRGRPGHGSLSGMKESGTGAYDFTGLHTASTDILGGPGDYLRQPEFCAGAWRAAAVALGGMDHLLDLFREELVTRKRVDNPHQKMRVGQALIARETALLWTHRAAVLACDATATPEDVAATVNLARIAVEQAGLDIITLVQRGLGLSAFIQSNPIEAVLQDLATYLRQPAPDETLAAAATWFMTRDPPSPAPFSHNTGKEK